MRNLVSSAGTEELAHMEIISALVHQLTKNMTIDQIKASGFAPYFVDHTAGVYPVSAAGVPYSVMTFQVKGDPITDLTEDLAADATTAKEQPPFQKAPKPLISLAFRHFKAFCKNGIPATT